MCSPLALVQEDRAAGVLQREDDRLGFTGIEVRAESPDGYAVPNRPHHQPFRALAKLATTAGGAITAG